MPDVELSLGPKALACLGDAIAATGMASCCHAVLGMIATSVPLDCALIVVYRPNHPPRLIHDALAHPERRNSALQYVGSAYLLDPFAHHARSITEPTMLRMADIAADHPTMTAYNDAYYRGSSVIDEVNYLMPLGPDEVLAISLERAIHNAPFSPADMASLQAWLGPVAALVRRHGAQLPPPAKAELSHHGHLRARLERFGEDRLTARERQVALALLDGRSVQQIGRQLEIATETCRVHRRNVYGKLEISSLSELFALALAWLEGTER